MADALHRLQHARLQSASPSQSLRHNKDLFPHSYSIDPWPDPLVARVWDSELGYVGFLASNLWEFVPELYRRIRGCEMPNYGE